MFAVISLLPSKIQSAPGFDVSKLENVNKIVGCAECTKSLPDYSIVVHSVNNVSVKSQEGELVNVVSEMFPTSLYTLDSTIAAADHKLGEFVLSWQRPQHDIIVIQRVVDSIVPGWFVNGNEKKAALLGYMFAVSVEECFIKSLSDPSTLSNGPLSNINSLTPTFKDFNHSELNNAILAVNNASDLISSLTNELTKLNDENTSLQDQLFTYRTKCEELEELLDELNAEKRRLESQVKYLEDNQRTISPLNDFNITLSSKNNLNISKNTNTLKPQKYVGMAKLLEELKTHDQSKLRHSQIVVRREPKAYSYFNEEVLRKFKNASQHPK